MGTGDGERVLFVKGWVMGGQVLLIKDVKWALKANLWLAMLADSPLIFNFCSLSIHQSSYYFG